MPAVRPWLPGLFTQDPVVTRLLLSTLIAAAALWSAIGVWMMARFTALGLRARGDAWLVTGATIHR